MFYQGATFAWPIMDSHLRLSLFSFSNGARIAFLHPQETSAA